MSRIFLSHSSRNNEHAIALRQWLLDEGWDDVFLDLDPEHGIFAGERWERALYEAADRCEAVLFLVSREWLDSDWCLQEFHLAEKLNKQMLGIKIDGLEMHDLPQAIKKSWQIIDLHQGHDHRIIRAVLPDGDERHVTFSESGLTRFKNGLTKMGLDPRFFAWPPKGDPDRSPYRGLKALDIDDAGIFFGRESPTIMLLDRLRGLREAAAPRLVVILGASGAGKSSFLRAGLLARLRRDDRHFLPLPIIRPERAAISGDNGLVAALEDAFKKKGPAHTRAALREVVDGPIEKLISLLDELVRRAQVPAYDEGTLSEFPTLVLAIDQAEELFLTDGQFESRELLKLIAGLAEHKKPELIILFTIRTDAYDQLQKAPELEGEKQETFSLPPLQKGAFQIVIEGPARKLQESQRTLQVDPNLTEKLLRDVELDSAKDTLPLLAFTLERLYLEHGGDGNLSLDDYTVLNGIKGSIEASVKRAMAAADADPRIPKDSAARLALLRKAFIPWLASIDPETGKPRRRVALLSEIPDEARPMLDHFVQQRLLASDISPETGEATLETAHEALLRQWTLLDGWLMEESSALLTVDGVKRASRDWADHKEDPSWLVHTGGRLEDAGEIRLRDDFSKLLKEVDRQYLDQCHEAEYQRKHLELEQARKLAEARKRTITRTLFLAGVAFLFGFLALGMFYLQRNKTQEAREQSALLVPLTAEKLLKEGNLDGALLLTMDALRVFEGKELPDQLAMGAHNVLELASLRTQYEIGQPALLMSADKGFFIVERDNGNLYRFDGSHKPQHLLNIASGTDSPIEAARYRQDKNQIILVHNSLQYEVFDVAEARIIASGQVPAPSNTKKNDSLKRYFDIQEDGLVSVHWSDGAETGAIEFVGLSIFDIDSGASYSDNVEDFSFLSPLKIIKKSNNRYIADMGRGKFIQRLIWKDKTIVLSDAVPAFDSQQIKFLGCALGAGIIHGDQSRAIQEFIDTQGEFAMDYACQALGENILLTYTTCGSGGCGRNGTIVDKSGKIPDEGNYISVESGAIYLPVDNPEAVALEAMAKRIAIASNRGIKVYEFVNLDSPNEPDLEFTELIGDEPLWHETTPNQIRFLAPNMIMAFEESRGRITLHTLKSEPFRPKLLTALDNNYILQPLNLGTCNGVAVDNELSVQGVDLPDQGKLQFESDPDHSAPDESGGLTLTDTNGMVHTIPLPRTTQCIQFSADLSHLVLVTEGDTQVHDLVRILKTKSLGVCRTFRQNQLDLTLLNAGDFW